MPLSFFHFIVGTVKIQTMGFLLESSVSIYSQSVNQSISQSVSQSVSQSFLEERVFVVVVRRKQHIKHVALSAPGREKKRGRKMPKYNLGPTWTAPLIDQEKERESRRILVEAMGTFNMNEMPDASGALQAEFRYSFTPRGEDSECPEPGTLQETLQPLLGSTLSKIELGYAPRTVLVYLQRQRYYSPMVWARELGRWILLLLFIVLLLYINMMM